MLAYSCSDLFTAASRSSDRQRKNNTDMNMIAFEPKQFKLIFSVSSLNRFFIVLAHALISLTMFVFLVRDVTDASEHKMRKKSIKHETRTRAKCIKGNNWCADTLPVAQHVTFS